MNNSFKFDPNRPNTDGSYNYNGLNVQGDNNKLGGDFNKPYSTTPANAPKKFQGKRRVRSSPKGENIGAGSQGFVGVIVLAIVIVVAVVTVAILKLRY